MDWVEDLISKSQVKLFPTLHPHTLDAVNRYVASRRAKGVNEKTILRDLYTLRLFSDAFGKRDYAKATREDLEAALTKLEQGGKSESTKEKVRVTIKSFYKYAMGKDLFYPEQVAWIKSVRRKMRHLPDLLEEEDIATLLGATKNLRDKAIIALLFDSGIRAGELINMKAKDVDLAKEPAHIIVDGKTGMRQVPIMFSVPYLADYLNAERRKPGEHLFTQEGVWKDKNMPIDNHALGTMLRKVAKRAGIGKHVHPHLFRHSRATYYANRLTEQQLKVFFGWVGDSKMASTYVHLSGRDIDNAILRANGFKTQEVKMAPKLVAKICAKCKASNTMEAIYCTRCGAPLDISTAMKMQEAEVKVNDALLESIKDPKIIEEIVHAYLMQQKEKSRARG